MHQAEHDEGPAGAVPDTNEDKCDQRRHRDPGSERAPPGQPALGRPAVERQRDRLIDIRQQEPLQRHVPPPPVVDDRRGAQRRVEIERQLDPEHPPEPDRHVGIAREVHVQLQRVGRRRRPRPRRVPWLGRGVEKQRVGIARQRVGDDRLLRQPEREDDEADDEVAALHPREVRRAQLRDDLRIMDDRPGEQLREKRREQAELDRPGPADDATRRINQIGDLLEGEERDRQRQDDVMEREVRPRRRGDILDDEVGVFVIAEQPEIDDEADHQPRLRRAHRLATARALNDLADDVVENDREQQDRQVARPPPCVEDQAGERQDDGRRLRPEPAPGRVEGDQRGGQEAEDEDETVEQHQRTIAVTVPPPVAAVTPAAPPSPPPLCAVAARSATTASATRSLAITAPR